LIKEIFLSLYGEPFHITRS